MNNQTHKNKKTLCQSRPIAIARGPVPSVRKPIAFARQLLSAPVHQPAFAPVLLMLARICNHCVRTIQGLAKQLAKKRSKRRNLEIMEIQQLGEKRFVAIIRVGKQKFLIGGAATSVSLLAEMCITSRPLSKDTA